LVPEENPTHSLTWKHWNISCIFFLKIKNTSQKIAEGVMIINYGEKI